MDIDISEPRHYIWRRGEEWLLCMAASANLILKKKSGSRMLSGWATTLWQTTWTVMPRSGAILLSTCGAKTYQLIRSLVAPRKPADIEFTCLIEEVRKHFNPKPSVIVERFQFHSRVRQSGESVSTYVAELRRLSQHCEFGASLDDMLRDRLVCGISDNRIQRRLLAEADLAFKKALELAQAMESADRNTQDLQKATAQSVAVHAVHKQGSSGVCYRCGGKHWSSRTVVSETLNAEPAGKRAILREYAEARLRRQSQCHRSRGPEHSEHTCCERMKRTPPQFTQCSKSARGNPVHYTCLSKLTRRL